MGTVELGGREVNRLGVSLIDLRAGGMWGEPINRGGAIGAIRSAVEAGIEVIEVPVPFGPAGDLYREACARTPAVYEAFVVARLTGEVADLDVIRARLGRYPDLVLAEDLVLERMRNWGVALGAVVGPRAQSALFRPLVAVRGPSPALKRMVDWCESEGISYMGSAPTILSAGSRTVALVAIHSAAEVEALVAGDRPPATPPGAGPG